MGEEDEWGVSKTGGFSRACKWGRAMDVVEGIGGMWFSGGKCSDTCRCNKCLYVVI